MLTYDPYEEVRKRLSAQVAPTNESVNALPQLEQTIQAPKPLPAPVTMGQGQGLKAIQAPWAAAKPQPVQQNPNVFAETLRRAALGSTTDAAKLAGPEFDKDRQALLAKAAEGDTSAMASLQFIPATAKLSQQMILDQQRQKARKETIEATNAGARERLETRLAAIAGEKDKDRKARANIEDNRIDARQSSEQKRLDQAAKFHADNLQLSQGRADLQAPLNDLKVINGERDRLMKERQNLLRMKANAATNVFEKDKSPDFVASQKQIEEQAAASIKVLDTKLDALAEKEKAAVSGYEKLRGNATTTTAPIQKQVVEKSTGKTVTLQLVDGKWVKV